MKKKYFQVAALVLALVMAFAGCATPEPKPGGLELTEQQLAELAERLYPDIKREDTAMWGDPIAFKGVINDYIENGDISMAYVTILDENWSGKEDNNLIAYHTYVKASVKKILFGDWKENEEVTTRYYGKYLPESDTWWNVHPDTIIPMKGEKFLVLASVLSPDYDCDYAINFTYGGLVQEIDGEEYLMYRDGEFLSVLESLRPLKENEYTIKEVTINEETKETRKIAVVKAEVMEQALIRVLENKEYEEWEDGYIDRVTEKLKPLTDFSGGEE